VVSFPQISPPNPCMHFFSSLCCFKPTHFTVLDLINRAIFGTMYRAKAPRYVVFSTSLLLRTSYT
jgi:hypothetical protein